MKVAGWILTALATVIIGYNAITYQQALQEMKRQPMKYVFGGAPKVYSFTPPYSNFELLVMAAGIGGIILLIVGYQKELKKILGAEQTTGETKEKPEGKENTAGST